jgi:hypothetical protein
MTVHASRPAVVVIGGHGYLGGRIAALLEALPVDVSVAGRRSPLRVDLDDPSTLGALDAFDVVIDAADLRTASPDAAAQRVMEKGHTFVEISADPEVVRRLYESGDGATKGSLVLGAGLFPGLSNVLSAALARETPHCRRLELVVRYPSLSAAGPGTSALMARFLARDRRWFEEGTERSGRPMAVLGDVPFPISGESGRAALACGLAEGLMLHWSTGVATTRAALAPAPGAPGWLARLGLALTPWWLLRRRSVEAAVARAAGWFRGKVLRGRKAPVEVVARADAGGHSTYRSVWVSDGMEATAACVAAAVELLLRPRERRPGVYLPDQLFELPELVDSARRLAGEALEIEISRDAAAADRAA